MAAEQVLGGVLIAHPGFLEETLVRMWGGTLDSVNHESTERKQRRCAAEAEYLYLKIVPKMTMTLKGLKHHSLSLKVTRKEKIKNEKVSY